MLPTITSVARARQIERKRNKIREKSTGFIALLFLEGITKNSASKGNKKRHECYGLIAVIAISMLNEKESKKETILKRKGWRTCLYAFIFIGVDGQENAMNMLPNFASYRLSLERLSIFI